MPRSSEPASRYLPGAAAGAMATGAASHLRIIVLVFAGYYLGARFGLALTFLPNPISVLWPPNAIVFAAFLLVPRHQWWLVIAAALPAHLLAELQSSVPLAMVLCWFVSNVAEALIGAVCMRWFLRRPTAFDDLRGVVAFLVAAFVAIFLSSFLDAAFVVWNRWGQRGYWDVWEARLFSNLATASTLIPLIVTWSSGGYAALRLTRPWRWIEAIALLATLIVVTVFAFEFGGAVSGPAALIYLPLPVLLWAALRFGSVGASTAVAIVALLVIWDTGHAMGPFGSSSPVDATRAVQLFIVFVAPTLLCLAAVLRERERAEQSLRTGDRRFQLVLEATRDTVFDRQIASGKLWWSGSGLAQLGYGASDRPGDYAAWLALIHAEDRDRAQHAGTAALRGDAQRWNCEFRVRRRDGSYAYVHERGFVVRDEQGTPIQTVGSLTDITERRDLEELSQKLAHASRLTAMGELTASIAHEINQPMSAILSNVDAAEMLLDRGQARVGELREVLNDIRNDDLRASEIIRHIRGFADNRPADVQAFRVNDVIDSVMRLIAPSAQLKKIHLTTELGSVPVARGDRIHVQQVLLNLLLNGMDAMSETPGHRRSLLVGTAYRQAGQIEVWVMDRGHGIPAQHLGKLFDSFFTTKRGGMGLGLSISRSLVEAHGGRIWAENRVDGGATFRFTLPVGGAETIDRPASGGFAS